MSGLKFRASLLLVAFLFSYTAAGGRDSAAKRTSSPEGATSNPERKLNPQDLASPSLGTPGAPVTIVEFADFECLYCGKLVPVLDQLINAYPDQVRVIFKHYPLPMHAHSELAHEACVAAAAQGKFWEMYHLIFANQNNLEQADLLHYASQLRLNVDAFQQALETREYRTLVADSVAEGKGLGVGGTPTLFINGQKLVGAITFDALKQQVDELLGANVKTVAHLQNEGKDRSPRVIAIGAAPVRGFTQAPITVVEYADFQCPFCRRVEVTLDRVLAEYPDSVKLVFKNFPLEFHQDSELAHRAALAAGAQGKFWQMHDAILTGEHSIKRVDLMQMAKGLGLDMNRFASDLGSEKLQAVVEADRAEGVRLGVGGTPTFFVNGKELEGAATAEQFEEMINEDLRAKGIEPPANTLVVKEVAPSKGREGAPITIVWYSDIASPLEIQTARLMDQIVKTNPGKVRVIFKSRPLEFHHDAYRAHEALMAAEAQGRFWPMFELLLAHQQALTVSDLLGYASELGLDSRKFADELRRQVYRGRVDADLSEARQARVFGVPVFFVNGERIDGVQTLPVFQAIIEGKLNSGQLAAGR